MINATDSVNVANVQGTSNIVKSEDKTSLVAPFAPIGTGIPNTFRTEHGYYIRLPQQNIGGPKVTIQQIAPNQYLVVTKATVYNSKPQYELYSEAELVKKYGGQKLPILGPIISPPIKA